MIKAAVPHAQNSSGAPSWDRKWTCKTSHCFCTRGQPRDSKFMQTNTLLSFHTQKPPSWFSILKHTYCSLVLPVVAEANYWDTHSCTLPSSETLINHPHSKTGCHQVHSLVTRCLKPVEFAMTLFLLYAMTVMKACIRLFLIPSKRISTTEKYTKSLLLQSNN